MEVTYTVTPKLFPPKTGPAGPILAEYFANICLPGPILFQQSVWLDHFWQPKLFPFC